MGVLPALVNGQSSSANGLEICIFLTSILRKEIMRTSFAHEIISG